MSTMAMPVAAFTRPRQHFFLASFFFSKMRLAEFFAGVSGRLLAVHGLPCRRTRSQSTILPLSVGLVAVIGSVFCEYFSDVWAARQ